VLTDAEDWVGHRAIWKCKTGNAVKFPLIVNVIHFKGDRAPVPPIKKAILLSTQKYRTTASIQLRFASICCHGEVSIVGTKREF
jgi:hypothetical protein